MQLHQVINVGFILLITDHIILRHMFQQAQVLQPHGQPVIPLGYGFIYLLLLIDSENIHRHFFQVLTLIGFDLNTAPE
jgi:hypothetical protein